MRYQQSWALGIAVGLLALALAGCAARANQPSGETAPPSISPGQPPGAAPLPPPAAPAAPAAGGGSATAPTPAAPPPQGGEAGQPVADSQYNVTSVAAKDLPGPAATWLNTHRQAPAFAVYRAGGVTYLLAAAGQAPTGGYSLRINSVSRSQPGLEVSVAQRLPQPGEMVTQVINWPVAAAVVRDLPEQPVSFRVTTGTRVDVYQAEVLP